MIRIVSFCKVCRINRRRLDYHCNDKDVVYNPSKGFVSRTRIKKNDKPHNIISRLCILGVKGLTVAPKVPKCGIHIREHIRELYIQIESLDTLT